MAAGVFRVSILSSCSEGHLAGMYEDPVRETRSMVVLLQEDLQHKQLSPNPLNYAPKAIKGSFEKNRPANSYKTISYMITIIDYLLDTSPNMEYIIHV